MHSRQALLLLILFGVAAAVWLLTRPSANNSSPRVVVPQQEQQMTKEEAEVIPRARDEEVAPKIEKEASAPRPQGANATAAPDRVRASVATNEPANATPAGSPPPRPVSEQQLTEVLDNVRLMIRDYRTALGENPVGTNAEIMRAINGDNAKQARIGPPAGQNMNANGELVDPWGTPFFFHQVSGTQMEIRSAGPDRIMWTADDREAR
jgi:hypothetical protein